MPKILLLICFGFVLSLIGSSPAHAQVGLGGIQPTIEFDNPFPAPGDRVEATVKNFDPHAPESLIWRINGTVNTSYNDQRSIRFSAGRPGETTSIAVHQGERLLAQANVTPVQVDIIIEPDTYTPAFYPGRGLPSAGAEMRLTALVNDGRNNPTNHYTYTWRINNQLLDGGPMRGNYQTSATTPNRRSVTVTVELTRFGAGVVARETVQVPVALPEVHFYTVSSLYGTQPRSLGQQTTMTGNNLTIQALPFYAPREALAEGEVTWRKNGRDTESDPDNPFIIDLQRDGQATAMLNFLLRHPRNVMFNLQERLQVRF